MCQCATTDTYIIPQVDVVRAGDVGGVAGGAERVLHADGRVARVGRRPLPRARPQRHRALPRTLPLRPSLPLPLAGALHEDARSETSGGRVGDCALGYHCSHHGQEESFHHALISILVVCGSM